MKRTAVRESCGLPVEAACLVERKRNAVGCHAVAAREQRMIAEAAAQLSQATRACSVKVEAVLEEITKLRQLFALELPETLFRSAPPKLVTHYRQRAGSEPPRELRRHPPEIRYTLLAALCWQREREITDNVVELVIRIADRVEVRAEDEVEEELLRLPRKLSAGRACSTSWPRWRRSNRREQLRE